MGMNTGIGDHIEPACNVQEVIGVESKKLLAESRNRV